MILSSSLKVWVSPLFVPTPVVHSPTCVGEANTAGLAIARQKLEHFRLGDFPHKEPGTAISLNIPIWFVGPEQGNDPKTYR